MTNARTVTPPQRQRRERTTRREIDRRALIQYLGAGAASLFAPHVVSAQPQGPAFPLGGGPLFLEAARLFDGTQVIAPAGGVRVMVENGMVTRLGDAANVPVPADVRLFRAPRGTIMPGLIDLHFHIEEDPAMALRQLGNGITAFRDPGEWLEVHEPLRARITAERLPGPRLFLTGPHIDGEQPAYPKDSVVARDPEEARRQVHRAVDAGATAIKIYYRLPLGSAIAVIQACHERAVPSTAHLEIVDAGELIAAGLTGIEHITSFGVSIAAPMAAEAYRQAMLAENSARRDGRYALFAEADLDGPQARRLYATVAKRQPFVDATLAVFEARPTDPTPRGGTASPAVRAAGFKKMQALVKRLHDNGARIVMGGHTEVPHAGCGEAPWRELELIADSGLTTVETLAAGTRHAAAFLGKGGEALGAVRAGAPADLLLVDGDPSTTIGDVRRITQVIANGVPVDIARLRTL
ncbi:MAG TPA: amidohydrolase family protein [Luteitalea sp.]|nr:amidohydrolase family protein [Luteitalea sp.]